jgi:DNA-binding NarL/FixJ family response regulator
MESLRTIHLMHVEDDALERHVIAHHLGQMKDHRFEITCVATEQAAIETFQRGGIDFILLDYQLEQGNGLSCLRALRRLDPIVPIIAISGVATSEIALELVKGGADDYIQKQDLTGDVLRHSVLAALKRADALRSRMHTSNGSPTARLKPLLREFCAEFVSQVGPNFLARLDELETAAGQARMGLDEVRRLFDEISSDIGAGSQPEQSKEYLRPVFLELFLRIYGKSVA